MATTSVNQKPNTESEVPLMTTRNNRIEGKQEFSWLVIAGLEMAPPKWGRPLRSGDVRAIAAGLDPDKIGALAVWHRPHLAVGHGRFVVIDGQHRLAALRLIGWNDQRVPCIVYEGLTIETAAELSMGLQERHNLHAFDKHRGALAAHEQRAVDVDKVCRSLGLVVTYTVRDNERGKLSAIATLNRIWDRVGTPGLERVLTICGHAWDYTSPGFGTNVLKLVLTLIAAHDGTVNDAHLAEVLSHRSPGQWTARDVAPRRSLASLAQDVIVEYNKHLRGDNRLPELTPSDYTSAVKRTPGPYVRGELAGRTSSRGTSNLSPTTKAKRAAK